MVHGVLKKTAETRLFNDGRLHLSRSRSCKTGYIGSAGLNRGPCWHVRGTLYESLTVIVGSRRAMHWLRLTASARSLSLRCWTLSSVVSPIRSATAEDAGNGAVPVRVRLR